ncbi:MAG: Snf7 family protein [Thermoguttaceae bacterium]|nr:Snf7 family protein [Thermoguttaceae bacterium]
MGIGDSFSNLFKSDKERKREAARRLRRAFTKAEDAVDTVNSAIRELNQSKLKAWEAAKNAAAAGRKAEALLALQKYRGFEVQVYQLEKRKWVFENYIIRLKMADVNNVFAESMRALNDAVQVDVDLVVDSMEDIDDKLSDVTALDKMWEKNFDKNMNGMSVQETDIIPDVDSLFASLQGEVALDIGGGGAKNVSSKASVNDVQARMDAILKDSSEK